jgi:hypothetical protein
MPPKDDTKKRNLNLTDSPESFAQLPAKPSLAQEVMAYENDPVARAAYQESQDIDSDYKKEATRSMRSRNDADPYVARSEGRARSRADRAGKAEAAEQKRSDFWDQGKQGTAANEAQQERNAAFQRTDAARQGAKDEAIAPIREQALARNKAQAQEQQNMQDPDKRMAALRMDMARDGRRLSYAELSGPEGKKSTYMRPTKEGTEGYLATRGKKNFQDMANKAVGMASAKPSPGLPQNMTAAAPQAGIDRATNATAAATPKPAAPNVVMPTYNRPPAQPDPNVLPPGAPAQPDPNAAAAIASFNQTQENLPRGSSMAQTANLQNLQKGNVPTLANVPGDIARSATGSAAAFMKEGMQQNPNRARDFLGGVGKVLSGKTPLVGKAKTPAPKLAATSTLPSGRPVTATAEAVAPQRPVAPRTTVQAAQPKKKQINPLLASK